MQFSDPKMLRLGLSHPNQNDHPENYIEINKKINNIISKARKNAKLDYCYYCKKPVTSFCNSHSVPQFCLKKIAIDGRVYYQNTLIELPFSKDELGIREAGTFPLICRDCDSRVFREYEDPDNYQCKPTNQMLAQIAMKNCMQMISKRLFEYELYQLLSKEADFHDSLIESQLEVIPLDLLEYEEGFERAKRGALREYNDWYYLCYFEKLDYVVPLAFQSEFVLISDLENREINNIYNMDPRYKTQALHAAVFPMEEKSIIILFIDKRDNRYKNFYKQLRKLSIEEQLSTINYIIFSYSENVYFSKDIPKDILEDNNLISTSQMSTVFINTHPFSNYRNAAKSEFRLSKKDEIPNLLSRKFCIR